jgi:transketolase
LNNLTCIIDRNFIQIDGSTEDIMPLEPLGDKYRAFNWAVFECDGNDIGSFTDAVAKAQAVTDRPQVIVANTVPGKGVSYMEGDYTWHGKPPNKEQADIALKELADARERMLAHA